MLLRIEQHIKPLALRQQIKGGQVVAGEVIVV